MLPARRKLCGRWPAAHRSKLVLPMPPTTASSFFNFAISREVRSKRFMTLVLRVLFMASSLVKRLAPGQQRREDQRHRRLRGEGLLDRAVDDEFELIEP